jgi:hypothetical protein
MADPKPIEMSNTNDIELDKDSSFLLIGDAGTGKTRFLSTCPKPFIYDFDKGAGSIAGTGVPYKTFKDAMPGQQPNLKAGIFKYGDAYPRFLDHINNLGLYVEKGTLPFSMIALDSLTTLSMAMKAHIQAMKGTPGGQMSQPDYGSQKGLMEAVLGQLVTWPVIAIATAHAQRNTNDLTGAIEKLPLLDGKLAGGISIFFDEIYFTEVIGKDADRKYVFKTMSDAAMKQAHTAIGVPDNTEQDWIHIQRVIDARKKVKS